MRAAWLFPVVLCLLACGHDPDGPEAEVRMVGVWVLDAEAFRTSFVRMVEAEIDANARRGTLPPDDVELMRTKLLQQVHDQFSGMWARFTFREDGTFTSEGKEGTRAGRWGVHGIRLSLTVTEEKGVALEAPDVWPGTVEGDVLTLRPEAGKDYEIVLRPEP